MEKNSPWDYVRGIFASMYCKMKPYVDFVMAAVLLVMTLPVMLALALTVSIQFRRHPLFRQQRVGRCGKPFYLFKFRTIAEPAGAGCVAENHLSPFCRFIRETSLDELPQLINVLKGEMALVGPRPLVSEDLRTCSPLQMGRHAVLPGITGWAQVNGRNLITPEEKFSLDLWYIEHISFMVDLRILIMTIYKVIKREGVQLRELDHAKKEPA